MTMRVNVYTEELLRPDQPKPIAEIISAEYISSRTGQPMKNYGLRIYLASAPELHYIEGRDDDRSAVTFWCGEHQKNVFEFLEMIRTCAEQSNMLHHRAKVQKAAAETEAALRDKLYCDRCHTLTDEKCTTFGTVDDCSAK